MKKFLTLLALIGFMGTSAHATTFNYADYADGDGSDGAVFTNSLGYSGLGEFGYKSYSVTKDGITVTATGSYTTGDVTTRSYAYLDRGDAGLGVCKVLDGSNQCTPSSDDNVTGGETLTLDFGWDVDLQNLSLVNGSHTSTFTGQFEVIVDSVSQGIYALASLVNLNMVGTNFQFVNVMDDPFNNAEQFYISSMNVSAVPVPAAGILFATALFGAGAIGRRKKKAAKTNMVNAFARAS